MSQAENNNTFNFYRGNNNRPYGNSIILNEVHNTFPALIYESDTFETVNDVFSYIHNQIDYHYNTFNRNRRLYHNRLQRQSRRFNRGGRVNTTSYRTPVNQGIPVRSQPNIFSSASLSPSDLTYLISMFSIPATLPPNFNDAVPVVPSETQVANGSTTLTATNPVENGCSICQDDIGVGDELRRLSRCRHVFHKSCIDTWFAGNVHCPVCRFDIREDGVPAAV